MQRWRKLGLIHAPRPSLWWSQQYCILPTPELREDRIRVYFASTDASHIGRIAFVDLSRADPTRVLAISPAFVLDAGEPGAFDDCGVNPSCVVARGGKSYLYYVGYQRTERLPYLLFPGVAEVTEDKVKRLKRAPVLDRIETELTIRTAPTIVVDGDALRMWYICATGWLTLAGGKLMPRYCVKTATSPDGINWTAREDPCLTPNEGELGFGRPWVVQDSGKLRMWFSVRRLVAPDSAAYLEIGTATSADGLHWDREDAPVLSPSAGGWDSEMVCYASVVHDAGRQLMFYNGNNNGATGFGLAVREA